MMNALARKGGFPDKMIRQTPVLQWNYKSTLRTSHLGLLGPDRGAVADSSCSKERQDETAAQCRRRKSSDEDSRLQGAYSYLP
jgi:hypothetical protein